MKFIILLSVLVVVTQQQYNQQFMVPRSWLPFSYHQSSHYDADPQQHGIYDYSPYNRLGPVFIYNDDETTGSMPMENQQYVVNQHQRYVEPRVKDYGPHRKFLKSIQQQKFLFGSSTSQQPFTKTATFFITSTCTALTVSSCIPRLNLLPAAPAAVPNCRRKREFNPGHLGENDNGQFSITPSQVRMMYPTALPDATTKDNNRRIDIVSSKEDNIMDITYASGKGISISSKEPIMNHGRFLPWYFLTSVTKTTWGVVSSVFTSTYVPAVNLNCLPPSYIICPEAGK